MTNGSTLKAEFSGNIAEITDSTGEIYITTNQDNAVTAIKNWLNGGALIGGSNDEEKKLFKTKTKNILTISPSENAILIEDNHNQKLTVTNNIDKAVSAIKSWIYGGHLG
jgi:hypothetical protein